MHIPPYYKKKSWQRFLVGTFFGAVIGYCILLYMYGSMYEDLLGQNIELQSQVKELKLLQDKEDDQKPKESYTVNRIEISITNEEELKLDKLLKQQLEDLILEEIDHIIGQDVRVIAGSDKLLESTIENKDFTIDDLTYTFSMHKLIIGKTVKLTLEGDVD